MKNLPLLLLAFSLLPVPVFAKGPGSRDASARAPRVSSGPLLGSVCRLRAPPRAAWAMSGTLCTSLPRPSASQRFRCRIRYKTGPRERRLDGREVDRGPDARQAPQSEYPILTAVEIGLGDDL